MSCVYACECHRCVWACGRKPGACHVKRVGLVKSIVRTRGKEVARPKSVGLGEEAEVVADLTCLPCRSDQKQKLCPLSLSQLSLSLSNLNCKATHAKAKLQPEGIKCHCIDELYMLRATCSRL